VGDVVDHPLGNQGLGQFGQAPGRERKTRIDRVGQGDLRDLLAWGRWTSADGHRRPSPTANRNHRRRRCAPPHAPVGPGESHLPMSATSVPHTDSSTVCARRQVITDPDERRSMRSSSRLPSSSRTSRTRKPSRATTTSDPTPIRPITATRRRSPVVGLQGERSRMPQQVPSVLHRRKRSHDLPAISIQVAHRRE